MITLTLPAPLAALLPEENSSGARRPRAVTLDADSWADAVQEIRARYPLLAERVFTEDATELASGVVLVVNREMAPRGAPSVALAPGDEISFIPQIAGG